MDFTTQLRIVLLLAGGVALLCIYWLGRRHGRVAERAEQGLRSSSAVQDFGPVADIDEDELETPAYLRRAQPDARTRAGALPAVTVPDIDQDWTPADRLHLRSESHRSDQQWSVDAAKDQQEDHHEDHYENLDGDEHLDDVPDDDELRGHELLGDELSDDALDQPMALRSAPATARSPEPSALTRSQQARHQQAAMPVSEPVSVAASSAGPFVSQVAAEPIADDQVMEPMFVDESTVAEDIVLAQADPMDDVTADDAAGSFVTHSTSPDELAADSIPVITDEDLSAQVIEPPTIPAQPAPVAPVLNQAVHSPSDAMVDAGVSASDAVTAKKPAPPLAKRKIVALRLLMPERVPGEQLLSLFQRENLQHGRFDIFHRLHADNSVFSVASMVEPGSFDLRAMRDQQFPGVTLFMLLPGPLDGLVAWDQMVSCAHRLAHATQGVLQDERGARLTSMATDRLREEVLDFQHLIGSVDLVSH